MDVEVLAVSQEKRTVTVRHMPQSERALMDAICQYWKDNELPFSITEVLRYEKPQKLFYAVYWIEGEHDARK